MPAATEVVSFVQAREYLGLTDESRLDRIEQVLDAAVGYCEIKTREKLLTASYVDVLNGSGWNELALNHAPVTSVTQLRVLTTLAPEAWDVVSAALYPVVILTPGRRRIAFRNRAFECGMRNWEVTYAAGYGDADGVEPIPANLVEAVLQAAQVLWTHFDRHKEGILSVATAGPNGSTITYLDQALPKTTVEMLEGFRKRRWA